MHPVKYVTGDSDIGQIFKIFDLLGTPGPGKQVAWEGVEALPHFNEMFPNMRPKDLRTHAITAELCESRDGEDLLRRMLAFDPLERISAVDALKHPFLNEGPVGSPSPEKSLSRAALLSPPSAGSFRSVRSVGSNDADGCGIDALSVWDAWKLIETVQRNGRAAYELATNRPRTGREPAWLRGAAAGTSLRLTCVRAPLACRRTAQLPVHGRRRAARARTPAARAHAP